MLVTPEILLNANILDFSCNYLILLLCIFKLYVILGIDNKGRESISSMSYLSALV